MADPAERFIAAAVAPLGDDAELRVMATHELRSMLSANPVPARSLIEASRKLERKTPDRWSLWKTGLVLATVAISCATLHYNWRNHGMPHLIRQLVPQPGGGFSFETKSTWEQSLTPGQKLVLFGDVRLPPRSLTFQALWESDPSDPAYFAEYSVLHEKHHGTLPPDFEATARRIDPENAWFTLFQASVAAKGAVERSALTLAEKRTGKRPALRILDEARYREALRLLYSASLQPGFDSHQSGLLSRRIAMLPPRTDFPSQLEPIAFLAGQPAYSMNFRALAIAVETHSAELAASGDARSFRDLSSAWRTCMSKWSDSAGLTLIDALVLRACLITTAPRLKEDAEHLGLSEEAHFWGGISGHWETWKQERDNRSIAELDWYRSSALHSGSLVPLSGHSTLVPPLADEVLLPGRWAEHEYFRRAISPLVWLILGAGALSASAFRFRTNRLVRSLSIRFESLLHRSDQAWIIGGGALLPFLHYQIIDRLTPWGGRGWGTSIGDSLVVLTQWGMTAGLMLMLPILIADRMFAKRGVFLGFGKSPPRLLWLAALIASVSIPLSGQAIREGTLSDFTEFSIKSALGSQGLALAFIIGTALYGSSRELVRRACIARAIVPAYVFGMLLVVSAIPFYHAEEKRWVSLDRVTEISSEAPAFNRHEHDVTQVLQLELRKLLGSPPEGN